MHVDRSLWLLALVGLVMAWGCDSTKGDDTKPDAKTYDVTIPVSECSYDSQCTTTAVCTIAKCVGGECTESQAPTWSSCSLPEPGSCERGACNEAGNCIVVTAADSDPCDEALWNECVAYRCHGGQCAEEPLINCDDDNPCTNDSCDPQSGCAHTFNTAECDDGNPCTGGDACKDGECVGDQPICECLTNAECVEKDDGDMCNGVLVCDFETKSCVIKEGSVVTCDGVSDNTCTEVKCNPNNGQCEVLPVEEYSDCDDGDPCTGCAPGDPCTQHDFCLEGECKPGLADPCTCTEDVDCLAFDDDDICNGIWRCFAGVCAHDPTTLIDCSDQEPPACHSMGCDPKNGACTPVALENDTECDDGDACTDEDKCTDGKCGGTDVCGCTDDTDCVDFDDGVACNGIWTCQSDVCAFAPDTALDCSALQPGQCEEVSCTDDPSECVLIPIADETTCDDADMCTNGDVCMAGKCEPGTTNACACGTDADCKTFDDGDMCNGIWKCDDGTCAYDATTVVDCSGTAVPECHYAECDPTNGQCEIKLSDDETACDDGDACTGDGSCDFGTCMPGTLEVDCSNEGDQCNTSACDPADGECKDVPKSNDTGCDDDNACTSDDMCTDGTCGGTLATDDLEENDSVDSAEVLDLPANETGLNVCTDDEDFYALALTSGWFVEAVISNVTGPTVSAELIDIDKATVLASSAPVNGHFEVSLGSVPADGTYYLRVYVSGDPGVATYDLAVTTAD